MKKTLGIVLFGALTVAGCKKKKDDAPAATPPANPPAATGATGTTGAAAATGTPKEEPKAPTGEALAAWYQGCWQAFSDHKLDDLRKCYADDATSEQVDSGMPATTGADAIAAFSKNFVAGFPDAKGELQLTLVSGHKVLGIAIESGTNSAPMMGMDGKEQSPTGKKLAMYVAHLVEVNDAGKVQHEWWFQDGTTLMGQLGMVPAGVPFRTPEMAMAWPTKETVVSKDDDAEKAHVAAYTAGIDAFNKHDWKAMSEMHAPGFMWSDMGSPKDQNAEEMQKGLDQMVKAFSDVKLTPSEMLAGGDWVVSLGTFSGTNDGAMPEMGLKEKTGKTVNCKYLELVHLTKDGKADHIWLFNNSMAMAQQLGLIPDMAKAEGDKPADGEKAAEGDKKDEKATDEKAAKPTEGDKPK